MNIDKHLLAASKVATSWSAALATEFARGLGVHSEPVIDWDDGAGESWVRLIVGNAVVAYVSTVFPVAIIERNSAPVNEPDSKVQKIMVEAMASRELSSAKGALEAAFGDSPRLDALNTERFSADELWYATV